MRQLARQLLNVLMVAVLLAAGGVSAYAAGLSAFEAHEHGVHEAHDHGLHQHADSDTSAMAGAAGHDDADPASQCSLCAQIHVHSCCSYAVPAADLALKLSPERMSVPVAASHIPAGQLASPLYRPPCAIA